MNLNPNVLIFSVYKLNETHKTNIQVHVGVLGLLKQHGIPAIELEERRGGNTSYMILVSGFQHRATVTRLCQEFDQLYYLESHNDRYTNLILLNGTTQPVGRLMPVSESEANASAVSLYNAIAQQHFVIK